MSEVIKAIEQSRERVWTALRELAAAAAAENRNLSTDEQSRFDSMTAELDALDRRLAAVVDGEQRAKDIADSMGRLNGTGTGDHQDDHEDRGSGLAKWAREARYGDTFDITAAKPGAERRARDRVVAEHRAMSPTGGVDQDGVYGQLWEYAIATSQLLQAGVDIINTADGNPLPFPVVTAHAQTSDTATAANSPLPSSDATISTVLSQVAKHAYLTLVPTELVQDATFDLEGYLAKAAGRELGRRVAKIASAAAVAGFTTAGVTGPVGTTTSLGSQTTAGQGSDLLVDLYHSVLPEYRTNAAFVAADPTVALLRKLKANGEMVWQDALTAGNPGLVLGAPVYVDPFLPSPAASAKTLYYGDWSALKVRIAGGLRFERSNEYGFGNDQIAFRAIVRTGAVTVDPNAVKFFAHSAT